MAYTLKSNATTALAKLVWVGDNVAELGHVNLVDSSAVSVVGTLATGSRGGHVSYGDGATFGNHLQATLAAIPSGTTYCYLIVGHVGKDPSTTAGGRIVISPDTGTRLWMLTPASTRIFQATDSAAGDTPYVGPAFSPNTFPSDTVYSVIGGRTATGKQSTIANGTEVARNTSDAYVINHAVSAGVWKFAGSPGTATNQESKFSATLFAVFVGLDQNELATYIAANGTGATEPDKAFSALLDAGASDGSASGSVASASLTAPTGSATGTSPNGSASGSFGSVTLTAPTGTATGSTLNGSASGSVAAVSLTAATGSASGTTSGAGTITLGPLKNNTGTVLASLTGITVHVYQTSGALVVTKTGQTTNGSGTLVVSDAAIAAATQYRCVIVLGTGAEGMDKATAA